MKQDQSRLMSEQDGGPFLEVATLQELVLYVSAGYGSEETNDQRVYQLAAQPAHPLTHYASEGWLDPTRDQSQELTRTLGVLVIPKN